jgi:mannose-6-phosphate isomerase-like protein (cupin superfamily)
MYIVKEEDVPGVHIEEPHKRVIRHIVAPWTMGSKNLWIGTSTVEPGNSTNTHSHDINEEVFYCVSGTGKFVLDGEERDYTPGTVVFAPPGCEHTVINTGTVPLKSVCAVSPPFEQQQFKDDHDMK